MTSTIEERRTVMMNYMRNLIAILYLDSYIKLAVKSNPNKFFRH